MRHSKLATVTTLIRMLKQKLGYWTLAVLVSVRDPIDSNADLNGLVSDVAIKKVVFLG